MSDLGNANWSETDASNNASPPNGWPEGMNPSDVNNSARANMGGLKRWWDQVNAVKTSAGAAAAFTLTYDVASAALYDGEVVVFIADRDCVAAATLNKNSLGAKAVVKNSPPGTWAAVANGDWKSGQIVAVSYDLANTRWKLLYCSTSWSDFVRLNDTITMAGKAINEAQGANIASAATTDIGAATGNYVKITGTTTITALGTIQAGTRREVEFTGALVLTHNATSLILPTGANITTAAGDTATFISEGSGNWRCVDYQRANGTPLALSTTLTSWTPADGSGAGLSFTSVSARYQQIGAWVHASFTLTFPATADGTTVLISGLPVAVPNQTYAQVGAGAAYVLTVAREAPIILPIKNSSTFQIVNRSGPFVNSDLSGLTVSAAFIYPAS